MKKVFPLNLVIKQSIFTSMLPTTDDISLALDLYFSELADTENWLCSASSSFLANAALRLAIWCQVNSFENQ